MKKLVFIALMICPCLPTAADVTGHLTEEEIAQAVEQGDAALMIPEGQALAIMPNVIAPETMDEAIYSFNPVVREDGLRRQFSIKGFEPSECESKDRRECYKDWVKRLRELQTCTRHPLDDTYICE